MGIQLSLPANPGIIFYVCKKGLKDHYLIFSLVANIFVTKELTLFYIKVFYQVVYKLAK